MVYFNCGSIAQRLEPRPHKPQVAGSNPAGSNRREKLNELLAYQLLENLKG